MVYGHPNIFHYFPIILGEGEGDTHLVHGRLNFLGYRILGEGVGEVVYIASTIGMFVVAGLFRDSCVGMCPLLAICIRDRFQGYIVGRLHRVCHELSLHMRLVFCF